MTFRKRSILLGFVFVNLFLSAQQSATYTNDLLEYQKALSLYNNKQYQAAQSLFETVKSEADSETLESDCSFYIANCAVRLNQKNADDLVQSFVDEYPTSTKRNTAFLDVADYYFNNKKYAYARKWYDKVEESNVPRKEREKYNFKYGYSLYASGNEAGANKYLNRVVNSKEYGSQAKYYIGFMAYEGDDYDKANEYFDQVSDEEKYKEKLSYYQADLNFKLGKFEEAIRLAKEQMDNSSSQEQSELSKIIGESYFNLQQYAEAIPYLKAYKGKRGRWNNTDYYQLGYAYYKQDDFDNAISEFNKIIDGNNAVAQNAYYHLGESYINLDKKSEALNAFRNASQMDFDLQIQEDAWLNYAKISYDIGNPYQSVPEVLSGYLDAYPKTSYKTEIETLLIDSYITSKNYKEALNLLKGKTSFENRLAYQKVAFYRGLEVYNEGDFTQAEDLFDKSIKEAKDPEFTTRAIFWKAETDYQLNNFDDALIGFKQFKQQTEASNTNVYENIDYNIAYTYFKLKNYEQSTSFFQSFISNQSDDKLRLNDAYLRLGDGHFVSTNYSKAIKAYDEAIKFDEIESDYAFFQKTMSYGYLGQSNKKIEDLGTFINEYLNSGLRDDALYELGNALVKSGKVENAMNTYERLLTEYPRSVFVSKVLLRQGLSYYNVSDNENALRKLKKVANDFPSTSEANQAVATARLIYIDLGRVDEYANWVRSLDYLDVTDSELDNTAYLAAEKQYLDNNTDAAIRQFNKYLNQFPNGIHALKSHFYLAELYAKQDLPDNAKPHYEFVVEQPKGEFSEQSMVKLSQIYLNNSNWNKAIPLLKDLETAADYPQNVIYAQSNLMNAFYRIEDYDKAINYAELTLQQSNLDPKVEGDAHVIIARSALKLGDEDKAKTAYAKVENSASGILVAEALYYNAFFKNQSGQFETSNAVVQQLAKDYSSYKYFSAKGLVVMAKNYYALDDAFQATYILESVIANFSQFDDVVEEAQTELNTIKSEEAKTNTSVETEQN